MPSPRSTIEAPGFSQTTGVRFLISERTMKLSGRGTGAYAFLRGSQYSVRWAPSR